MNKRELVSEVKPLPQGYSGTIEIENIQSYIEGNVALLSYDMDKTESIFGQVEKARYHETDTWMHRKGEWKIVAGQILRYYEDPAAGTLNPQHLNDYAGAYQLATGVTLKILQDDARLFQQKPDGAKVELLPEADPIFFRKGVEGRIIFRRGSAGQVNALVDRRNNEDVVWVKIK